MESIFLLIGVLLIFIGLIMPWIGPAFGLAMIWSVLLAVGLALAGAILVLATVDLVIIGERQVGVVVKKFSTKSLPAGRLVALNGEAGYQADTWPRLLVLAI
jgi:hypothetical protein